MAGIRKNKDLDLSNQGHSKFITKLLKVLLISGLTVFLFVVLLLAIAQFLPKMAQDSIDKVLSNISSTATETFLARKDLNNIPAQDFSGIFQKLTTPSDTTNEVVTPVFSYNSVNQIVRLNQTSGGDTSISKQVETLVTSLLKDDDNQELLAGPIGPAGIPGPAGVPGPAGEDGSNGHGSETKLVPSTETFFANNLSADDFSTTNDVTVAGNLIVTSFGNAGTECLQVDVAGLISTTGSACGAGGGGGGMTIGDAVSGATSGSVLFADASGDLGEDNANFYYNATTHRLGLGDATPVATLTIGAGDLFQVNSSGAIAAATGVTSSGTITFSGFSSNGGPLYTNDSGVLAQATAGSATQILHGGTTPSFGSVVNADIANATIDLTTKVTGTLPVGNGGSGVATFTSNGIVYGNGSGALQTTTSAANSTLVTNGSSVPSLSQTLPTAVQNNITSLGTISTGVWNGTTIGVANGGTNISSFTAGDLLYASGATTLSKLGIGSLDTILTSTGSAPQWVSSLTDGQVSNTLTSSLFVGSGSTTNAIDLATAEVAGTLSASNGGTGATTLTSNGVLYGNGIGVVQATTQGAANTVLVANAGAPSFSSAITVGTSVTSPTINATTALQVGGANINTAGTLNNVAYLNQANTFSANNNFSTSVTTPSLLSASALTVTPAAGSNLNISLSGAGDFALNTSQLYADTSSGLVGIGTTSPDAKLAVSNTATTGSELLTNGTFTGNANGWTLGDCAAYGSNKVTVTYTLCNDPLLSTDFNSVSGQSYQMTFTVNATGDEVYYYFDNNNTEFNWGPFSSGTYTVAFSTDYTGVETIYFDTWNYNDDAVWDIDNVSIKALDTITPTLVVKDYKGDTAAKLGFDVFDNIALGANALQSNTIGLANVAIGPDALQSNTTGPYNIAIGQGALSSNVDGWANIAMGRTALETNTSGNYNLSLGYQSMRLNTNGSNNIALGSGSLRANTSGSDNISIGTYAMVGSATSSYNIGIGGGALSSTTMASNYNIGIGGGAASSLTSGDNNIAIGQGVLGGTTTGSRNIALGNYSMQNNVDGNDNAAFGYVALLSNTDGDKNTALGVGAMGVNTTGNSNIAVGYHALYGDTTDTNTGSSNVAIGVNSLQANKTGYQNTVVGENGLYNNTTGYANFALGNSALYTNTTGQGNTAIGINALYSNVDGSQNTALGGGALQFNTSGALNVALSTGALYKNTTGSYNVAMGLDALRNNIGGWQGVAIGSEAGKGVEGLSDDIGQNVFVGYQAGTNIRNGGVGNIALGYRAGDAITTGTHNIIIGYDIDAPVASTSNQLSIGNLIFATSMDGTGTTLSTGNIGIGDNSPAAKFTVGNGDLFQVNSAGAIAAATGVTSSGAITFSGISGSTQCLQVNTSGVVSGTGSTCGGAGVAFSALTAAAATNSINNADYAQTWAWNTLSSNNGLTLSSTSTAAASNAQTILNISTSGANASTAQTTYGAQISNIHTNATSGTNVALYLNASGATTANYGLIVNAGNVGIGDTSPVAALTVGSGDLFQVNSSGQIAAAAGYIQGSGTHSITSANTTQSTTASAFALNVNSLTTGTGAYLASSTLSSGNMIDIAVTGTAALTNQKGINVSMSGANGTGAQTTYGGYFSNTHTGTSTNVGLYSTASGGSNNYAAIFAAGYVGIGTTAPATFLDIDPNSNTTAFRIRGLAESTEIGDIYVAPGGNLVMSTANTSANQAYIEVDGEDDNYGFVIRDSNTGSTDFANFYYMDTTTDYLNMTLNNANSTAGLVLQNGGNVGVGDVTPAALFTVGNGDLFQVNSAGAIAAVVGITSSSNYVQSTGTMALTSNVTNGTGTSAGLSIAANSLASGVGVNIASNSTQAGSNTQILMNVALSGNNASSGQTTYAMQLSNTHANATSGTNVGLFINTSGATTANYALVTAGGNVGIGDGSPTALFTVGSGHLFQVNSSGAIAAAVGITSSSNYVQSAGTMSLTSANTTQATTSSAMALNLNSLTTGTGLYVASSTLSSGSMIDIAVTGTAGLTNQKGINVSLSGANGTGAQTTYGGYFSNTHTGTSTNVGLYATATGGTNNYAGVFESGYVGIGTTAPTEKFEVAGGNIIVNPNATPTLKGSVSSIGSPFSVDVVNNIAYVADSSDLRIIDVSNPSSPALISTLTTPGNAWWVQVVGKYAYIADGTALTIADISNPNSPTQVGTVSTGGTINFMVQVSGRYAYVVIYGYGLKIIDISNPASPTIIGSLATLTNGLPYALAVSGKYAYVADNNDGVKIIDVSNPTSPTLIGTSAVGNIRGIDVQGKYVYAVGTAAVKVINVSNPASPAVVTTINTGGYKVRAYGHYLYVFDGGANMYTYDISDPTTPTLKNTYTGGTSLISGFISGKNAYVADSGAGLKILDLHGIDSQGITASSVRTGNLVTNENLDVGGSVMVRNGINIGAQGILSQGPISLQGATSTSSTATIDARNLAGTSLLYVRDDGNIGIGNASPTSMLSVGSSSQFQVNSSGAIAAATGITSSGTINFSGLTASSAVYTDGSKNLTSTAPTSGSLGYWSRTSTTIQPATANDIVAVATTNTTGADLAITNSGIYTGTGILNVTANSLTTGVAAKISVTGMGNGTGLKISSSASLNSSGKLIDLDMGAAADGYGMNITTTGAYAGYGLISATANSATSGVVMSLSSQGQTSGWTITSANGQGTLTTGGLLQSTTANYNHTGTQTGKLIDLAVTDGSTNASGAEVTTGIYLNPIWSTTNSAGTKTLNGVDIASTFTNCGTTAGTCTYNGINSTTGSRTQSTTNNLSVNAFSTNTPGALVQNTAAGTIAWTGLNVSMPAITQTTGTVTSVGIKITGGTVTSGSAYAFTSDINAGNVGIGTTAPTTRLEIGSSDLGNGTAGPVITLGRNTNATNTGAGSVNYQSKAGTAGYVWQDAAGYLRIHTAAPSNANDTAGVVVGDQTSTRNTKQNIESYTNYAEALNMIVNAPLKTFKYVKDVQGYGSQSALAKTRLGYIADEVPAMFMWGNSIDQVSVNGLLMASVKELNTKIETVQSQASNLQGSNQLNIAATTPIVLQAHLYLSEDSVGQAKILAGNKKVRVSFVKPYQYQPIATATPTDFIDGSFRITKSDSTGFTIELQQTQNEDITFNWHSFAGPEAKLTVSNGDVSLISLQVVTNEVAPETEPVVEQSEPSEPEVLGNDTEESIEEDSVVTEPIETSSPEETTSPQPIEENSSIINEEAIE